MATMYEVDGMFTKDAVKINDVEVDIYVDAYDFTIPEREEIKRLINNLTSLYENASENEIATYNRFKRMKRREKWVADNERTYENPSWGSSLYTPEGFVYVIKEHFSGTYKIGKTINVKNRTQTFGSTLPFDWDYVKIYKSPDKDKLEEMLHDRYSDSRKRGEWFNLSGEEIEFLTGEVADDNEFKYLISGVEECPKRRKRKKK